MDDTTPRDIPLRGVFYSSSLTSLQRFTVWWTVAGSPVAFGTVLRSNPHVATLSAPEMALAFFGRRASLTPLGSPHDPAQSTDPYPHDAPSQFCEGVVVCGVCSRGTGCEYGVDLTPYHHG